MTSILTTGRIVCQDTEARERVIEAFRKIIDYTVPNEPGNLQYLCAVPYHDNSKNEVYVIEEHANQEVLDAHMENEHVQDIMQLFFSGETLLKGPEFYEGAIVYTKTLGSASSVPSGSAVVLLTIPSQPNQSTTPMRGLETLVERLWRDIKGIDKILVAEEKTRKCMRMECVLQDWDGFTEFQNIVRDEVHDVEMVQLKHIYGFAYREGKNKWRDSVVTMNSALDSDEHGDL